MDRTAAEQQEQEQEQEQGRERERVLEVSFLRMSEETILRLSSRLDLLLHPTTSRRIDLRWRIL